MSNNSKQWSSATPGLIIFLVDQSGSMNESYTGSNNKAEFTATVINRTIFEVINDNMAGTKPKDRVFISIIGYGGQGGNSVEDINSNYLSVMADNPLRIEKRKQKMADGNGGIIEIEVEAPIFIDPIANGLTPMGDALSFAKDLINGWIGKYPNNPAPVIINVSDGIPYSGPGTSKSEKKKTIKMANEIMGINTQDGNPLIFNAHIGTGTPKCGLEESESELSDTHAKFLFEISSVIPDSYKVAAAKHNLPVKDKSRGFVSNADPELFIQFINFGSSGASDKKN